MKKRPAPLLVPEAAQKPDPFLDERPTGRKASGYLKPLTAAFQCAESRSESGNWKDATPNDFVGLYAVCHKMVYGVLPDELNEKKLYALARKRIASVLHSQFDDDPAELAEFVRWVWTREAERVQWAKSKGFTRNRIGVLLQFSASMVTDYRVATVKHGR
jgi:hypothetical protein